MIIEVQSPPRTIFDVYKILPEGTLAELINGQIYMSPAPSTNHQRVTGKLFILLSQFIDNHSLGEVFASPYDVFLDEKENAVQPDLVFVSTENSSIIRSHGIVGTPDLVIEILSPGNTKHDLELKHKLYERFGVKEYWIIDPSTKESVVYQLLENEFLFTEKNSAALFSPLFNHSFSF